MFDIRFIQDTYSLKKEILAHRYKSTDSERLFSLFEEHRCPKPYLFSIETTNVCNMTCVMCPRTTEMDRKIENMDVNTFNIVAEQIFPHESETLADWIKFVEKEIGIRHDDKGENHFYFFISSQAVTIHGFGEPVLDPYIKQRIEALSTKKIPSHFS